MKDAIRSSTTDAMVQRYELVLPQTEVRFRTRHVLGLFDVTGSIRVRSGFATVNPRDGSLLTVEAVLDMQSFASASHSRDRMVASPRFLDSDAHPDATYRSSSVQRGQDGWLVDGDLTVKGMTAAVELQVQSFEGPGLGDSPRMTASAIVDRTRFGITVPSAMVARNLLISIDTRAVRTI